MSLALPGHTTDAHARRQRVIDLVGPDAAGIPHKTREVDTFAPATPMPSADVRAPVTPAGMAALRSRAEDHSSVLPLGYDKPTHLFQRKMVSTPAVQATAKRFPPYALGNVPDSATKSSVPTAAATVTSQELATSMAAAVDGSSARLHAAFAKQDPTRQGKVTPGEFAATARR